jgi:hypothetical protein
MDDHTNLFNQGLSDGSRRLSEDVAEYFIYVIDAELQSKAQINGRLKEVQTAATRLSTTILKDYIWQSEDFKLEFKQENGQTHEASNTLSLIRLKVSIFCTAVLIMVTQWRMNGSLSTCFVN